MVLHRIRQTYQRKFIIFFVTLLCIMLIVHYGLVKENCKKFSVGLQEFEYINNNSRVISYQGHPTQSDWDLGELGKNISDIYATMSTSVEFDDDELPPKLKQHFAYQSLLKENGLILENQKVILRWYLADCQVDYTFYGHQIFAEKECEYQNCVFVANTSLYNDVTRFDAIIFSVYDIVKKFPSPFPVPWRRSQTQKYIFASNFPAPLNPIANNTQFENFFNWTWTYRLDSDFHFRFITVYDKDENVVGPAVDVKWVKEMLPITDDVKIRLKNKTKVAVSFGILDGIKKSYLNRLRTEFYYWGLECDLFTPRKVEFGYVMDDFNLSHVMEQYYFLFAFESVDDTDFVTGWGAWAFEHFAVPVVHSGANYSRFLPPNSYLNAKEYTPKKLAKKMRDIVNDPTLLHEFHRWRSHYSVVMGIEADDCELCAALNDERRLQTTMYPNFSKWWMG